MRRACPCIVFGLRQSWKQSGAADLHQMTACLLASLLPFQGALHLFISRFNIVTDYRMARNMPMHSFSWRTVIKHAVYVMNPKNGSVNKK